MHTNKIRILPAGLSVALLLLIFTACDNIRPDISITVQSDYNSIIEAVRSTNRSLVEKLQLIEAAVASGFADDQAAQELLRQAISSISGTMAQKLAAVEAAVSSQTTVLETKLGLIEAAVAAGFADAAQQQALIQKALESLEGSVEQKLASVENAINSKTASLEMKLALIEAAVKEGLADEIAMRELLQQAVQTLSGTLAERLEAIEKAMENQASSLSSKLDLIEAAVKNRMVASNNVLKLINQALATLSGTAEARQEAIIKAVQDQTTALEMKLALIEAAVTSGFADSGEQEDLLRQALLGLKGTAEEKLAAISTAVGSLGTSLAAKMDLIETAVSEGFVNSNAKAGLIKTALTSLTGTYEEKLAAIDTAVKHQTDSLTTKLELIQAALQDSLAKANDAIGLIEQALSSSLKDGLDDILTALEAIEATVVSDPGSSDGVLWMIQEIRNAIKDMAKINYTAILGAIQHTIYYMGHNIGGYEYVELGPLNGTGPVLKWATMNIGASAPQNVGDYFAWAETEPYYSSFEPRVWKTDKTGGYADSTNRFAIKVNDKWTYDYSLYDYVTPDQPAGKDSILRVTDDAARQQWGDTWRMPTQQELLWLARPDNFTWEKVTNDQDVLIGVVVTSKLPGYEGNSIFLPVTGGFIGTAIQAGTSAWGYYWSSTIQNHNSTSSPEGKAQGLSFYSSGEGYEATVKSHERYWGFAIRPVSN